MSWARTSMSGSSKARSRRKAGRSCRNCCARASPRSARRLPVVKIDEKLGLEKETYRTLPILRSDGTTLYSTKDLALTKRKFEDLRRRSRDLGGRRAPVPLFPADLQDPGALGLRAGEAGASISATRP